MKKEQGELAKERRHSQGAGQCCGHLGRARARVSREGRLEYKSEWGTYSHVYEKPA